MTFTFLEALAVVVGEMGCYRSLSSQRYEHKYDSHEARYGHGIGRTQFGSAGSISEPSKVM